MSSLKKLALRGAAWTIAGYGMSQILRFGSNVILARLLYPELFGLMALVNIFIIGLHLFSDIGIGPSIIQNRRGNEPDFLNTAWTLQIVRGCTLWFCCLLLAKPISLLYGEPQLFLLLPVVGLSTVISGFNSTSLYTLNRQMAIAKLAIFELGGQAVSIAAMITWAWFDKSIWALVVGTLVGSLIQLIWSHWLNLATPNRWVWDREAASAIFSFGKWIFVSTAVTFLAEQSDRLMLGKMISFELLGVYGIAFIIADIPRQVVLAVSSKVLFPAFSQLAELPRPTFRAKILKNRQPILLAVALGVALLVSFGDFLILALYDSRYSNAAWMLPVLALGIWPRILTQTIDQVLFAIGKSYYPAYGCVLKFIFMVVGLPTGFYFGGMLGAIAVVALNDLPFYAAIVYGLEREELSAAKQDIQTTGLFLALLVVAIGIRLALGLGLPGATVFP
ncbi:oligosaccharide flippase family protein [Kamptonema animale CS-326]|jgi:O-antigen/teichoic acid export membrane protein|nr:oligosaccharide flippase family protein [Kamptonema animale]MDB9511486.1 oligosaccharide flippase family protein [Kamptonema animale CS-326]